MRSVPATSQIFIVTFPFLTFRKLKATVGTTFSLHCQGRYYKSNRKRFPETVSTQGSNEWSQNRPHLSRSNHIDKRSFSWRLEKNQNNSRWKTERLLKNRNSIWGTWSPTTAISACLEKNSLYILWFVNGSYSGSQVRTQKSIELLTRRNQP